jgi:hypothetical protein
LDHVRILKRGCCCCLLHRRAHAVGKLAQHQDLCGWFPGSDSCKEH